LAIAGDRLQEVIAPVTGARLAGVVQASLPDAISDVVEDAVYVAPGALLRVCRRLRDEPSLAFDYLIGLTAVDYVDYFEVVYHLLSISLKHSAVVKMRLPGRTDLRVPSVTSVWKAADFQEREVWDLLGIAFDGHPNLTRIMMWEGFPGHPLRKDFLEFDHRTFASPPPGPFDGAQGTATHGDGAQGTAPGRRP
jgi:NADH-quinone oxidoreductase subunit C